MSDEYKKFWLVWCPSRGVPTKMHESYEIAIDEASRLAEKHPCLPFHVMESQCTCRIPPQNVKIFPHHNFATMCTTEPTTDHDPQF